MEKKSKSTTIDNKSTRLKIFNCKGSKYYFDPQLITKRKVGINTSTSKQMYGFGTESRFPKRKKSYDAFHYDLPSVRDTFTTTFGYGKKFDFSKNAMKDKSHLYYDIPREFDIKRRNTPQYSFGKGRDVCKRPGLNLKNYIPGVGSYNLRKEFGKDALKFSIFGRGWENKRISPSNMFITPGPGHYEEILKTNSQGRYASSLLPNTRHIKFVGPEKDKRVKNNNPPPWAYNLGTMFNRTGFQYTSKFNSTIAKTISNRPRLFYLPYKKSNLPGPGSYDFFSDFEGYTDIHKKCKCGRILGHPPVYDDSRCGRYMQTYDTESNNNHSKIKKKLTISTDDAKKEQKTNGNVKTTAS